MIFMIFILFTSQACILFSHLASPALWRHFSYILRSGPQQVQHAGVLCIVQLYQTGKPKEQSYTGPNYVAFAAIK